jgi:WD40 repeat protein
VLRGHDAPVRTAEFSADGRYVVTGSEDGTALVWRADGLGEPIRLQGGGAVLAASFHPDGTRVVTASQQGVVRIWRVGWASLLEHLSASTTHCLTGGERAQLLNESDADAKARAARCEHLAGR